MVVRTGMANLASVLAAVRRLGVEPEVTTDPEVVRNAPRLVLPGVGAFGAAMSMLREAGLVDPIVSHAHRGKPLLAVCLGLQLLCEASAESEGVAGLGVVPGRVEKFAPGVHIPQLGWNTVTPTTGSRLLRIGHAYFANSYRLPAIPEGWEGASTHHGGSFAAALERGPLLACQFHPELSGAWGSALIERWL
ncbi:MAG: imidazole glycerol phosphate synthase subunit HisH, partial [Myxococcota bacterium]